MSENTSNSPMEKVEKIEDNARKFIVGSIDPDFLAANSATSYLLIQDWIITDEDSERKLVYKKLGSGEVQYWMVSKVTISGNRTTEKKKISKEEYTKHLASSKVRVEKQRYEFTFSQGDISFTLKYDEFAGGKLTMLEVDSASSGDRTAFKAADFPYKLSEVTGDQKYYGYRVANVIDETK
jgi:hypothetical protein